MKERTITTDTTELTPLRRTRRAKAVAAAERVFVERGYRATTMEAIADEAAISKATLYGYLRDKDEAFLAVAEALRDRLHEAVQATLGEDGDERPARERIADALIAKHVLVAETVRTSPHARELFDAKDRQAAVLFEELDARIIADMAGLLVAGGTKPDQASRTVRLLFHAAQGVANMARSAGGLDGDIRRLTDALIAR